jgi:hypothetical protein
VPSLVQEFSRTRSAKWLREARIVYPSSWNDRRRCFEALDHILSTYRAAHLNGNRWTQTPVSPPHLLKDVAHGAHFSSAESVYQRWRAQQGDDSIKRWAGDDPRIRPREAFVAEAKLVSFWPYRTGALAVADRFEMSLAEVSAAYLRALGLWAENAPVLAACIPVGPPPCVLEDMEVLAARALKQRLASHAEIGSTRTRLAGLADRVVSAILADASITPLGAFNTIRDEALRLFSEPSDPIAMRVSYALTELADRLLHRRQEEQVVTREQALNLQAEMTGLGFLLASMMRDSIEEPGPNPGQEPGR